MNFNDVAIVSVKWSGYIIHFWYMSKNDAINIMNNSNWNDERGVLQLSFLCIKMGEKTYYQRNRDVIQNREKDYYENDKED